MNISFFSLVVFQLFLVGINALSNLSMTCSTPGTIAIFGGTGFLGRECVYQVYLFYYPL